MTSGVLIAASGLVCAAAAVLFLRRLLAAAQSRGERQAGERFDLRARDQSRRFEVALNTMSQGLCMFDARSRLIVCNDRYAEIFGLPPEFTKPGTPIRDILQYRVDAGLVDPAEAKTYVQERLAFAARRETSAAVHQLKDGRVFAYVHRPLAGGGWLTTHEDITARQRAEAQIAHMARHDPLTDLANRTLFMEKLEEELARLPLRGWGFAVFVLDLDRFKEVNDSYGHPVGDALLRAVAERLIRSVEEPDVVARVGGDEFAIVQTTGRGDRMQAAALAERIVTAFRAPFDLEGQRAAIGVSIGVALAPQDGVEPSQLLKNADLALYRAKSQGRNGHRFFELALDIEARARWATAVDLRWALERGEFELHYQTIVDIGSGETVAVEALARWRHPKRGLIPPDLFIPLIEESDLINAFGAWVLRTACRQATAWPEWLRLSVNVSAAQFRRGDLTAILREALNDTGLAPRRLDLEITESVLLHDNAANVSQLRRMKDLGVSIAIDDFGAGFSSLGALRMFAFDTLKIDKSFIQDLATREDCMAIVGAVTFLAKSLRIATIAEGVETAEQLALVRAAGCRYAQGYFFSRPRPAESLDFSRPAVVTREAS